MVKQTERRAHRPHERHVHAALGALSGIELEHRVAQPASTLEVDWVVRSSGVSSWLGPLSALLAEPTARPPR